MGASCTKLLAVQLLFVSGVDQYLVFQKINIQNMPSITYGRVVDVYDGDTITIVGYVKHNRTI